MVSAALYGPLVERSSGPCASVAPRPRTGRRFAQEIALLRRGILAADMLLCAGLGYWIGLTIGG